MAEQALKKLEDQLNCPICLDTYTDPKQLNCHHVYCQQCLSKLVFQNQPGGQQVLTCPNCRQVTPVPASGVSGLQAAFQINQLLEIVEEHKNAKVKDVTASAERVKSASICPAPLTVGCPEHDGREVDLYCETCGQTICYKCIKKGEKHHSHDYEELDEAFKNYKSEIAISLEPMEKQLVTIRKALVQLDTCCKEIINQQTTMEANIHHAIGRLHQTLDVRKTELIVQLHRLTQSKLKSLAAQRDKIETTQARLSSCLHFMRENLESANQGEALMMKRNTVRQVKELTVTFQPDTLEPNAEADMTFLTIPNIMEAIQNYGQILEKCSPEPSKCFATGKGIEMATVGAKSTVLLQIIGFDNRPSKKSLNCITTCLVSEMTGAKVGGSVERRGQSQYEISYQPTIKGRHQLYIKVEGQHIRGSPFSIAARSPVEEISTPILTLAELKHPIGIAVNRKGEMVVTERDGHSVSVFSPRGEKLCSFGMQGSGQGQFYQPYGVAVDGKGCVLVADNGNHRIQKFTPDGRFLVAVGTEGSGPLQFSNPHGIAYSFSNDKVYLVDERCRIQILNSDLNYIGQFGEKGNDKGQFNSPEYLACDSTGNVYVADFGNHRIQVFTAEGKFLRMFGIRGEGKGELWGPWSVAIDSSDRVYVSELSNSRVSVFTSEGHFMSSFGMDGSRPGQFNCPTGLAVYSGVVCVCDCFNCRVQLF